MALLAGGALATGCVDSAEPATGSADTAITNQADMVINRAGFAPTAPSAELQVAGGHVSLASPGWTETAPGIWANASKDGANSIVIGAEGHKRAIAQVGQDLAALRAAGAAPELIQQKEEYLKNLEAAMQRISSQGVTPLATSCNIGFVIQASSPITGVIGEFAGAQLVCFGGTQTFTVQTQACTDLGCGPVYTFFPTVGSSTVLVGSGRSGTWGAFCSGAAYVSPPGVTASGSNACG